MKFQTVGEIGNPVIVMLPGSFCPSKGLKYVYEKLQDAYRIILPEYNGHYENSTFTTTQKKMYFFYGGAEKAYKTCYAGVKKAYPLAEYNIVDGYGHLNYSMKNTDAYVKMVRSVCEN